MASVTRSSAATIDLTDTTVNEKAPKPSTARQGGFSLRNRIDFASMSTANRKILNGAIANKMRLLQVPKGVVVKKIYLNLVPGETAFTGTVTASASLASTTLNLNSEGYKQEAQTALGTEEGQFGSVLVGQSSTALTLLDVASGTSVIPTYGGSVADPQDGVKSSDEWNRVLTIASGATVTQPTQAAAFPYGGFVNWQMPASGTVAASKSISLNGVLEVQADCMYVPNGLGSL
jgi:hypothetical protein